MRCITRGITAAEEDLPFGYSLSLFTKFHWVSGTDFSAGPFYFISRDGSLHPFILHDQNPKQAG